MPTIFRIKGLRVVIYPNDHRPPHVHVIGFGKAARFQLLCDLGAVRLMECWGCEMREIREIEAQLIRRVQLLCRKWGEIHG